MKFFIKGEPIGVGSCVVSYPEIPGLSTVCYDEKALIYLARQTLENHLYMLLKRHESLPDNSMETEYIMKGEHPGTIIGYIDIDVKALAMKLDNELVDMRVLVPHGLAKQAKDNDVSLTQLLLLGFAAWEAGVENDE